MPFSRYTGYRSTYIMAAAAACLARSLWCSKVAATRLFCHSNGKKYSIETNYTLYLCNAENLNSTITALKVNYGMTRNGDQKGKEARKKEL